MKSHPALWDAWSEFIKKNWPCSEQFLRSQLQLTVREARAFRKYCAAIIEPVKDNEICITDLSETSRQVESTSKRIKTLPDLLASGQVNTNEWHVDKYKLNSWEIGAKNEKNEIITETLFQVTAYLERKLAPQEHPSVNYVIANVLPEPVVSENKKALIVPDIQLGFRWRKNFTYLEPMHDRLAMDVVWQVAQREQPEKIILIGDMLDHAPLTQKFKADPDVKHTTQPALAEFHWWLAKLRTVCPHADIIYLSGNHEDRLRKYIESSIEELYYLRDVVDDTNPLTHDQLLHLKDLRIKLLHKYNEEFWLWGSIRVQHGREINTNKIMNSMQMHSEIQGHTHRLALNARTLHTPQGARVIYSLQPGTLCKVTGSIPPAYQERNDWQQGFGMVYQHGGRIAMQVYSIEHGTTLFENMLLTGVDPSIEIANTTGWQQLKQT